MARGVRAEAVDQYRLLRTFLDLVAIDSPTGDEEAIGPDLGLASASGAAPSHETPSATSLLSEVEKMVVAQVLLLQLLAELE